MPILSNCKSCDDAFDECGGSMSRGRHMPLIARGIAEHSITGATNMGLSFRNLNETAIGAATHFNSGEGEKKVVKGYAHSNVAVKPEASAITRATESCKP